MFFFAIDGSQLLGLLLVLILTLNLSTLPLQGIPRQLLIAISIFLTISFIHVFTIGDYYHSFIIFLRIYGGFCFLLYFYAVADEGCAREIRKCISVVAIATSVYVLLQYISYQYNPGFAFQFFGEDSYLFSLSTVRPRGLVNSAGGSASLMTLGVLLIIEKNLFTKLKVKDYLILLVLSLGLLLNLTRTFIFLLAFFSFITYAHYRQYVKILKMGFACFILILWLFIFTGTERYADRFSDIPGISSVGISADQAFMGRGLLLRIPFEKYKDLDLIHQVFGSGISWSENLLKGYFVRYYRWLTAQTSTHNDFVWLLCNLGFIGLLSYLWILWQILRSYRYDMRFFFSSYVLVFVLFAGLGGESINVTGHRFMQLLFVAYLYIDGKYRQAG